MGMQKRGYSHFRIDEEMQTQLDEMSDADGITESELLRRLVAAEYKKRGAGKKKGMTMAERAARLVIADETSE